MSNDGATASVATRVTHMDNHTSPWAKIRRFLPCSSVNDFEDDSATVEEQESLLRQPIRRGGRFMCIDVEWAEEKPKRRSHK